MRPIKSVTCCSRKPPSYRSTNVCQTNLFGSSRAQINHCMTVAGTLIEKGRDCLIVLGIAASLRCLFVSTSLQYQCGILAILIHFTLTVCFHIYNVYWESGTGTLTEGDTVEENCSTDCAGGDSATVSGNVSESFSGLGLGCVDKALTTWFSPTKVKRL